MVSLKHTGYRSRALGVDVALGLVDGVDNVAWCTVYASIIFGGALVGHLGLGLLTVLLGWILASVFVALTSDEALHVANTDEQAVVILGSITALLARPPEDAVAASGLLPTVLVLVGATSLTFAVCCSVVGRYRLSRLLEMLPFPVVCGFMAIIGWLLLGRAIEIATGVPASSAIFSALGEEDGRMRLVLCLLGAAGLVWALSRTERVWALPAALASVVIGYYAAVAWAGWSVEEQRARGWLLTVSQPEGGLAGVVGELSLREVDWTFLAGALPEALTIVFLALIYASMSLSALKANAPGPVVVAREFEVVGAGNLLTAAVCSPPVFSDAVSTALYRELGASSRWLALTSSLVGAVVLVFGFSFITYVPMVLVGAGVFFFAFQTLWEWLVRSSRGFAWTDHLTVWIILAAAVWAGFMQGILLGLLLTVFFFVFRYSRVSAVQSRRTLRDRRSSVERSRAAHAILTREGEGVAIYALRGFLFFGTANALLDSIVAREQLDEGRCRAILLDVRRVTDMDISALTALARIRQACEGSGALLAYSGVTPDTAAALTDLRAVGVVDDRPLLFAEDELALEYLEDHLLGSEGVDTAPRIEDIVLDIVGDEEKARLLLSSMRRIEPDAGAVLFRQGEPGDGLFIVESGALSAFVASDDGEAIRVKKFTAGSLIGEMAAFSGTGTRSATVTVDEPSVLHHLAVRRGAGVADDLELRAAVLEFVVRVLSDRLRFTTDRLLADRTAS